MSPKTLLEVFPKPYAAHVQKNTIVLCLGCSFLPVERVLIIPVIQNFQAIQGTIRAYTIYSLNASKKVAIANVDKVTLKFGIEVGGEAGVPYVTKGTAKSNLKITVECSFPEQTESKPSQASNS